MANIFISYNREDEDKTRALVSDMQGLDHAVWFDQALSGGQNWWDKILESIRKCDIFVFILSVESLDSSACRREYNYASELGKTILPILIGEGVSINRLPPVLSKLQIIDYRKQDRNAAFQLVKALASAKIFQALPDPLPIPPEVPLSYLGSLTQQIDSTPDLSYGEQSVLLVDLRRGLEDPGSSDDARVLLGKLRKRRDLFAIIGEEIDKLFENILQETEMTSHTSDMENTNVSATHQEERLEQEETEKRQRKNTINKKSNEASVVSFCDKGDALLYANDKEAIVEYDKALAIDPHYIPAIYSKGVALYSLERFEEAIVEYDKALAIDPNDISIYYSKVDVLLSLERSEEAIAEYDKVLAFAPNDVTALNSKGDILFGLERNDEAFAEYDKAMAINPNDTSAFYNKGIALNLLGRYEEAIAEYDKAIAIDSNDITLLNGRGDVLFGLGRHEEAITEYDKAIAIDPNDVSAFYSKADVLFGQERNEEAISEYDKAIAIDPDNIFAFYSKADALLGLGRNEEAIAEYDKAIAIDPNDAFVFNSKGDILFNIEQYDEAIIQYDKAIALNPDDTSSFFYNKGITLYILGQNKEAIAEYDKAIAIDPNDAFVFNSKGDALFGLGRNEEAITEYDKAIAIDPDHASAFYNKAFVYALENNKQKFLQNLKQAIQKNNEYKELAKTDEVLEAYWNDKDFKKLVDKR